MIVIEYLAEHNEKAWDDFVLGSESGHFFHLLGWKEVVEKTYGHKPHYMVATKNEAIKGVLPMFELKSRLFGHSLVSLPFAVYGGVCSDDPETRQELNKNAVALGELLGVDYVELRNLPSPQGNGNGSEKQDRPGKLSVNSNGWHRKDLYATFQREILPELDDNMKAIPRKQRAMVRKGVKNKLTSRIGRHEELDDFYNIYSRNVRDLGTPVFPKPFFRNILDTFDNSFILMVFAEGEPIGGVITFAYKDVLMPYYGAALRSHFNLGVNDFMYWELMRHGCENGYKVFDFGRSKKDTGPFHFKRHWGFEPLNLDYLVHLVKADAVPEVNPTNPKYKFFIEGWKRLPLPIANFLGPSIVKNIP